MKGHTTRLSLPEAQKFRKKCYEETQQHNRSNRHTKIWNWGTFLQWSVERYWVWGLKIKQFRLKKMGTFII